MYRCPACTITIDSHLVARNSFSCPRCGEAVRVNRWRGFRFVSSSARAAVFATLVLAGIKLGVSHWAFWQLFIAAFGGWVLFDEWDSIVSTLFPPKGLEVVEPAILTLGINRAS